MTIRAVEEKDFPLVRSLRDAYRVTIHTRLKEETDEMLAAELIDNPFLWATADDELKALCIVVLLPDDTLYVEWLLPQEGTALLLTPVLFDTFKRILAENPLWGQKVVWATFRRNKNLQGQYDGGEGACVRWANLVALPGKQLVVEAPGEWNDEVSYPVPAYRIRSTLGRLANETTPVVTG